MKLTKLTKKQIAGIVGGGLAVIVVAIVAIVLAMQGSEPEVEIVEEEIKPSIIGVSLDITAEEWNEDTSTPVVAMFTAYEDEATNDEATDETDTSTTEDESVTDETDAVTDEGSETNVSDDAENVSEEEVTPIYKELSANTDEPQIVELEAGEYTLTLISPINEDGSVYSVGDDVVVTAAEITDDTEAIELILIPAEEVTTEEIESIITALTVAYTLDDTVVSTEVLDRAKTNAAAGPNVTIDDVAAVEEVAEETAEAVESGEATAQAVTTTTTTVNNSASGNGNSGSTSNNASNNNSSNNSGNTTNNTASNSGTTSNSTSNSGGGSTTSNNSSTTSNNSGPSSSHTHNWVYVVDVPAQAKIVCNGCGETFSSVDAWSNHAPTLAYPCARSSYHSESTPEQGHYECSTCGARK